jgi:hypothetical protein
VAGFTFVLTDYSDGGKFAVPGHMPGSYFSLALLREHQGGYCGRSNLWAKSITAHNAVIFLNYVLRRTSHPVIVRKLRKCSYSESRSAGFAAGPWK